MLTAADIEWIKQNRGEITAGRTEVVDAKTIVQGGSDPITGEPLTSTADLSFEVIWEEQTALHAGEKRMIAGIEIQQGDVSVTFKAEDDPQPIDYMIRGGNKYKIIAIQEKGIGQRNRWICVAREVI